MLQWIVRLTDRIFGIVRPQKPVMLPPAVSLLKLDGFTPPEFSQGHEILNDDRTPMQFVVDMLNTHVGLSYHDSIRTMPQIHNRGGGLVPTASVTEAQSIAAAIAAEATREKHPLVCRAVSTHTKV